MTPLNLDPWRIHQDLARANAEADRLRGVLQSIADEDYRGYRPTSSVRAYEALQTDLRRSS